MSTYQLKAGEYSLSWGTPLELNIANPQQDALTRNPEGEWDWELPSGVYRARDIVWELGVLMDSVIEHLRGTSGYEPLLENVRNSLALSGREAVLQLDALALEDTARLELAEQARKIGETIARWAGERVEEKTPISREVLGAIRFRSRCDHHLWTLLVTDILTGPNGGPTVMQLFNEYLHQLVLLRDFLIPFENWEEVPIEIKHGETGKGLRFTEQARTAFLSEFLIGKPSHQSVLRYAQSGLAPTLSAAGYGFQYHYGTILPASLNGHPAAARRYLLRWYPVRTVPGVEGETAAAVFDYAYPDYYSASRSHVDERTVKGNNAAGSASVEWAIEQAIEAQLLVSPIEDAENRIQIRYRLRLAAADYDVDLGQIFRGHRYLYLAESKPDYDPSSRLDLENVTRHSAAKILELPGLVTADSGYHLIDTARNPLVLWALLGKLYPENVIVLEEDGEEALHRAAGSGKGFGSKFLIT
ncbi:hypothetical protein [Paenibacillus glycanilyticus]|uniref:hypothetical protein n=1 Tax=Paenibacillus glycanilyticus TaxID=126569 RepID=UPI001910CE0F|nr:hypothetical protein [Paenibacillus glycanilyticus]